MTSRQKHLKGPNDENPFFHFDFVGINITESHPFHNVAALKLLKFWNQELTLENYFKLQVPTRAMEFKNNVWNRKQAMFHASFSNCSRNYFGSRNQFSNQRRSIIDIIDVRILLWSSVLMDSITLFHVILDF